MLSLRDGKRLQQNRGWHLGLDPTTMGRGLRPGPIGIPVDPSHNQMVFSWTFYGTCTMRGFVIPQLLTPPSTWGTVCTAVRGRRGRSAFSTATSATRSAGVVSWKRASPSRQNSWDPPCRSRSPMCQRKDRPASRYPSRLGHRTRHARRIVLHGRWSLGGAILRSADGRRLTRRRRASPRLRPAPSPRGPGSSCTRPLRGLSQTRGSPR